MFLNSKQEEKNVKGGGGSKKKGKIDKVKPILVNKDEPVVLAPDFVPSQTEETNNFNITHPKDDLELIRSHSVRCVSVFLIIIQRSVK